MVNRRHGLNGYKQSTEHKLRRGVGYGKQNKNWRGGTSDTYSDPAIRGKKYRANHPETIMFNGMRARAKRLSIPFSLSILEFRDWYYSQEKVCVYCFSRIERKAARMDATLSIDRKYNEIGYVAGNICFCCYRCNAVKSNVFTFDQMKEIAEKYLKST